MGSGNWVGLGRLPPLRGLLPLALFLAAWQAFGPEQSPYFPPPSKWWTSVVDLAQRGRLFPAVGATLLSFAYGLGAAALIGGTDRRVDRRIAHCEPRIRAALGILPGASAAGHRAVGHPVAGIWSESQAARGRLGVRLANSAQHRFCDEPDRSSPGRCRTHVSSQYFSGHSQDRRSRGGSRFLLGVRVAVPLAIIITLLVEMLTLLPGIGSLIVRAQREYQSAQVYGLLVLVGMLGFLLNNGFALLESLVLRHWPPRRTTPHDLLVPRTRSSRVWCSKSDREEGKSASFWASPRCGGP